jgi:hypothetical protein
VNTHHSEENHVRRLKARWAQLSGEAAEEGATTVEYAIVTVAAAGFGALLIKVLSSPKVQTALSGIIEKALN